MRSERSESGDRAADLLVIGGGVIGLACAWRAAAAGIDVLVLDAGAEERASEVAAGMLAPVGEASWGQEALLAAALASAAAWPEFARELQEASGEPVPLRRCGALHVALDRDERAELRRKHDLHEELGLEARWLRAGECRDLERGLSTDVTGGYEAPGESEVDPRAVNVALRRAALAAGARFEDGRAEEILCAGGRARGARVEGGGEISADRVLAAAGARLGGELMPAAAGPPIRPVKGETARLRALPGGRPCERIIAAERIYIVPRADGEVVVGATVEESGFDRRVTAGGIHELLREAYRALPEIAELELVECSAGLRPGTPDNAPVIGETAVEGLLVAGGHFRNGILLAPITATAIGALLSGELPPPEIAALAPSRFERPRAVTA